LRVIAGQYRSRPLRSLRGADIRPTSDRLRETLFNVLTSGNPAALEDSIWLDLFAGTGAVGIEALSRGAAQVYFIESSPASAKQIRDNLRSLGIASGFSLIESDVLRAVQKLASSVSADYIYLDPPYRKHQDYRDTLAALRDSPLVKDSTVVIAEHEKNFDPGEDFRPLTRYRKLMQGDAALSFYRPS
jgi:16S rRNA (guanine966-N2)-methyltransferase